MYSEDNLWNESLLDFFIPKREISNKEFLLLLLATQDKLHHW